MAAADARDDARRITVRRASVGEASAREAILLDPLRNHALMLQRRCHAGST